MLEVSCFLLMVAVELTLESPEMPGNQSLMTVLFSFEIKVELAARRS